MSLFTQWHKLAVSVTMISVLSLWNVAVYKLTI